MCFCIFVLCIWFIISLFGTSLPILRLLRSDKEANNQYLLSHCTIILMNNSLTTLSSGAESVAQHLDVINQLCDQLMDTFAPSREQISTYASEFSSSLATQNKLLTDETLRKIRTLDLYLSELYGITTEENLLADHHELWTTIQEKIDLIVRSMLSDNYFHMTYGWRIGEIIHKLESLQHEWMIAV